MFDFVMEKLGASPTDLFIITIGTLFAMYQLAMNGKVDKLQSECKELNNKYHQVDKLSFLTAVIVQKVSGYKIIKQSADGKGDHALNREQ